VLAAASLTEVVAELGERFAPAALEASFAASSELARQIADGAPADVFLSASPEWTAFLRERGALAGEPRVFARNGLVCIAPRDGALLRKGARDLAGLSRALAPGDLVAIADAGVPAGEYARQAIAAAGLAERFRPLLVGRKDVRAVLQSVATGEMNVGFVYATDARAADVTVLFALDPKTHAPIVYEAALVKASTQRALAERFLELLRGDAAEEVLRKAGFALPSD
jgi:molybdate transport system substrate-binding protein